MGKKEKKTRKLIRLDDITNFFGDPNPAPEYVDKNMAAIKAEKTPDTVPWKHPEQPSKKKTVEDHPQDNTKKKESLTTIKKRVDDVYQRNIQDLPHESRIVSNKDIKAWIINNPGKSLSSAEFFNWFRSDGSGNTNQYVLRFAQLLTDLGVDFVSDVNVKGYTYDFFIPDMSVYIDIDPSSLETDDPKNKISVTIEKNRVDVVDIWRKINVTRDGRCKPYRFRAIKERLYQQEIRSFLNEYVDWYYQKVSDGVSK